MLCKIKSLAPLSTTNHVATDAFVRPSDGEAERALIREQEPCARRRRRCSEVRRMTVQMLWTVKDFCGTQLKTSQK